MLKTFTQPNDEPHELIHNNRAYFSEKIDLKSSRFVGLGLAIIQIIPHSQHKLEKIETNKLINMP